MKTPYGPFRRVWLAVTLLAAGIVPATSNAQGTVGFSLNGGTTEVKLAGEPGTSKPMFGLGGAYVYTGPNGKGDFSGGIQAYQYSGAGSKDSGAMSMFEIRTPFTFGYHSRIVAGGISAEYRQGWRSFDKGDGGNLQAWFGGAYLEIALGSGGSTMGQFALAGRYLYGFGEFQLQDGNTSASSDFHDWRAGIKFYASPKWQFRVDYVDTAYISDKVSLSQTQKAYLLTVGYVIGKK